MVYGNRLWIMGKVYGYVYIFGYGLWIRVMVYSLWFMIMAMVYGFGSQFVACGLWL